MTLKNNFTALLTKYTDDSSLIHRYWAEIKNNYTGLIRHYHTLEHLENLLFQFTAIKEKIQNPDAVLFALYYHDAVYNILISNNEEKSAELAEQRMRSIGVPDETIMLCKAHILATKTHVKSATEDTNYFTDADLSILGAEWEVYAEYFKNVRKEYAVYPDLVYRPGRKKVLLHFLSMERIFKTDFFFGKFEKRAHQNLKRELDLITR